MVEFELNQVVSDKSPYLIYQSLRKEPANLQIPDSSIHIPKPSLLEWFFSRSKEEFHFQKPSNSKTTK